MSKNKNTNNNLEQEIIDAVVTEETTTEATVETVKEPEAKNYEPRDEYEKKLLAKIDKHREKEKSEGNIFTRTWQKTSKFVKPIALVIGGVVAGVALNKVIDGNSEGDYIDTTAVPSDGNDYTFEDVPETEETEV